MSNAQLHEAMKAAGRDAVVLAIEDLRSWICAVLPERAGDLAWNALTAVQDWRWEMVYRERVWITRIFQTRN